MLDVLGLDNAAAAKLSDVAELNPRLKAKLSPDETVAFVPMAALSSESASVVAEEVRRYGEVAKGYTPFQNGDILVAKITPCFENGKIGQANLSRSMGFGSTEFHVVRPYPDRADPRYLMHYLRQGHILAEGERKMTGSAGQRRVPEHFIADLVIPSHDVSEQRRIAAILDQADALRAKRRAALTQLDKIAPAIFMEMFGDPVTNDRRFPLRTLKSLGRVVTGRTPPSSREGMFGGSIPFMTPGDLSSREPARRWLTQEGGTASCTVRLGSALVCCIGATIGKMDKARVLSAFNQQINAVEWGPEVDDEYGLATLKFFKHNIAEWGASTTLPILKKSAFESICIPVPNLTLQKQFGDRIRAVEAAVTMSRRHAEQLDTFFASLQHRAFRGEL